MREILHTVQIDARHERVHAALTTLEGLAGWWTPTVTGNPAADGVITFTFGGDFNPDMRVDRADSDHVRWTCVAGHDNWAENTFAFELRGTDVVSLRFTQHYARELEDDAYGTYNFNWGYYLDSLRLLAETGTGKPYGTRRTTGPATFVSIATASAKPNQVGALAAELGARTAPTRAQPGNLGFELLRSHDDPDTIVALEHWRTRQDWEHHLQGDHVTSLMTAFETLLREPPDIKAYTPAD